MINVGKPSVYSYYAGTERKDEDILVGDTEYLTLCHNCYLKMR